MFGEKTSPTKTKKKTPTKSVKRTKATTHLYKHKETKKTQKFKKIPIKSTKKKSTKHKNASSKSTTKKSTKKVKKFSTKPAKTKTKVKSPEVKRAKQPRFQSTHLMSKLGETEGTQLAKIDRVRKESNTSLETPLEEEAHLAENARQVHVVQLSEKAKLEEEEQKKAIKLKTEMELMNQNRSVEPLDLEETVLEKCMKPTQDMGTSSETKETMNSVLYQLKTSTTESKAIILGEYYSAIKTGKLHAPSDDYVDLLYIDESHPFTCTDTEKLFPKGHRKQAFSVTMTLARFRKLFPQGIRMMKIEEVPHKKLMIGETAFGFWVLLMDKNINTLYMTKHFNLTNLTKEVSMLIDNPITIYSREYTYQIASKNITIRQQLQKLKQKQKDQQYVDLHRQTIGIQRTSMQEEEEPMTTSLVAIGLNNQYSAAARLDQIRNTPLTKLTTNM